MKARDVFKYSLGSIRLRKLRSGLTTLGIVIGIAAIVALMSYTQGFEVAITNQFTEGFATNTVTVSTGTGLARFGGASPSNFSLYANDTNLIETLSYVQTASPIMSRQATLSTNNTRVTVSLSGIEFQSYQEIYSSTFVVGNGSIPSTPSAYDAIIGASVANPWDNGTLFAKVGDEITVTAAIVQGLNRTEKNMTITVVGVLNEVGASFFGPSDTGIYIPIDTAIDFFNTSEVNSIIVQLTDDSSATIDEATTGIAALFNNEVTVTSPTAVLNQVSNVLGTVELLLGGIAAISLLVAGVGIMNIMFVSVIERTREIGILKALGAKGGTVLAIFLAEAAMIGLLGGVFGIIAGYIIGFVLSGVFRGFASGLGSASRFGQSRVGTLTTTITPVITPQLAFMALAFGIIVSVVFALYPARRASKLQPVDALRTE
jgi:putative ABC transport system permease protein